MSLAQRFGEQRGTVSNPDKYRARAADCIRLAAIVSSPRERLILVKMAQSWRSLADQAEKNSGADLWYETPAHPRHSKRAQ